MKYSIHIHKALEKAIAELGDYGQSKFADKSGIDRVYINRWLNPDKYHPKTITTPLWNKLYPHIAKFLEENPPEESGESASKEYTPLVSAKQPEYLGKIINGQINVYGIPVEKVIEALNKSTLSQKQKQELRDLIFS